MEAVDDVPRRELLDALEKVHARFAHCREEKRQREAEERARADLDEDLR